MPSADLYIIAAGKGSRMKVDVPKALIPIVEEPCLTTTLQQVGLKFRKVFVVTNALVSDQWQQYFHELKLDYPALAARTVNLSIDSGLGDGHATLQGLVCAERIEGDRLSQDIVIAWGDIFIPYAELIDELLSITPEGAGLLPAVYEKNPYVALLVDEGMRCVAAHFSKYGEHSLAGFHDQSVFRFDRLRLKASLFSLHNALWKKERYIAPGGELSLLYCFHQLYNSAEPTYVYQTAYPTLTFNTVEEVIAVQRDIRSRWKQPQWAEKR